MDGLVLALTVDGDCTGAGGAVGGGGGAGGGGAEGVGAVAGGAGGGGGGGAPIGEERSPMARRAACKAIEEGVASFTVEGELSTTEGGGGGGGGAGVAREGGSLGAAVGGGGGGAGGAGAAPGAVGGAGGAVAAEGGSEGRCGIGMEGLRAVTGGGGGLPDGVGRRELKGVGSNGRWEGLGGTWPCFPRAASPGGSEAEVCGAGLDSGSLGIVGGLEAGGTGACGADVLDVSGSDRYDASAPARGSSVSN